MTSLTQLLNNFGFDQSQDQMVPESSFDILKTDGGATVFETAHKKVLPDFDALLKGIQSGVKEDNLTNDIFMERPAADALTNWDLGTQSELSLYEDLPALLPPVKTEKVIEQRCQSYQPPPPPPDCSLTALLGEDFTDFNMVDELKKKIDYACAILNIPDNPYQWSCDQTQTWVTWTLEQFNLPLYHFEDFQMDGTTLCMLSKADFQARSPLVGEYLFADLDIWKTAYSLSVGVQAGTTPEELTYLDLSNSVVNNPNSVSPMLSMTSIPTSVITSASMNVTSLKATNPNNVLLPRAAPPPISISPALSMDSLASNGSNNSSWTSLQEMEDNSDLSREVHHYRETGHVVTATGKHTIHLWQFLKELLLQPHMYQTCIRWMDRSKGIFKIEDSARVAKLWGQRKNRPAMNYDKLSRSIRQYYKKGIIKKTSQSKRLVYQFCPQYL